MSRTHLSTYTQVAINTALKAGCIVLDGFSRPCERMSKPGRQNYVTEYDTATELAIIESLSAHFPDHAFLGEESGGVHQPKKGQILWIIDPIDGTSNFAHQIPLFTISIAACLDDEMISGVIYQPITKELFVAEKGKGAFLNDCRLQVSHVSQLHEALILAGATHESMHFPALETFQLIELIKAGAALRNLGSAALSLAYVASGKLDGLWMTNLYPWDWAAGKLLIEEAGGSFESYSIEKENFKGPSNILASNTFLQNSLKRYMTFNT